MENETIRTDEVDGSMEKFPQMNSLKYLDDQDPISFSNPLLFQQNEDQYLRTNSKPGSEILFQAYSNTESQ